jgi:hypothetical protein
MSGPFSIRLSIVFLFTFIPLGSAQICSSAAIYFTQSILRPTLHPTLRPTLYPPLHPVRYFVNTSSDENILPCLLKHTSSLCLVFRLHSSFSSRLSSHFLPHTFSSASNLHDLPLPFLLLLLLILIRSIPFYLSSLFLYSFLFIFLLLLLLSLFHYSNTNNLELCVCRRLPCERPEPRQHSTAPLSTAKPHAVILLPCHPDMNDR